MFTKRNKSWCHTTFVMSFWQHFVIQIVIFENLKHCVNLLLTEDGVGRHPLELFLVDKAVPVHVEDPVIVTSDPISSQAA